jgi:PEP-CTERM motif
MKLHISVIAIAIACLVASSSEAQVICADNFNTDTLGVKPTGWTSISPSTPTPGTIGAYVVDPGSGDYALRMVDNSPAANARAEQDFASVYSGLHLSLSFTRNANITPTTSTQGLYVSLGASGASQGTQSNRAVNVRLFNDGGYRIDIGTQNADGTFNASAVSGSNTFGEAGATFNTHTLDIYAYSGTAGGATLDYTGPDSVARVLDPHSFAVYIDGSLMQPTNNVTANGDYGFETSAWGLYGGSNLGRLGLVTGGSSAIAGMDFLVDNISLSALTAVPEPSTFALLGLGGLLLMCVRRVRSFRSR